MSEANKTQIGGGHYKTKIEHWDYVVANDLNYFEGQITKYVTRCRKKNGMQDLQKALHFLQKYLEVYDNSTPQTLAAMVQGAVGGPVSTHVPPDIGNEYNEAREITLEQWRKFEAGRTTYLSNHMFENEGGTGSGTNIYRCRVCRAEVVCQSLEDAALHHSQPCALPRPTRAA